MAAQHDRALIDFVEVARRRCNIAEFLQRKVSAQNQSAPLANPGMGPLWKFPPAGDDERGGDAKHRYSPGRVVRVEKEIVFGAPAEDKITTSHVERNNLTLRMQQRRWTRLTNAFSRKPENHRAAFALHVGWYNLCRVHETLRTTPAMALGVTNTIWSIADLIDAAVGMSTAPLPPMAPPENPAPLRVNEALRALLALDEALPRRRHRKRRAA